jgi:hypothetical protein
MGADPVEGERMPRGRPSKQAAPLREATDDDLRWMAELFDTGRAAYTPYSTGFALRIHTMDVSAHKRLLEAFGGRTAAYAGSMRWLLQGDAPKALFERIAPMLSENGRQRLGIISAALKQLEADRSQTMGPTRASTRAIETEKKGLERVGAFSRLSAPETQEASPKPEVDAEVPPGPWTDDEPVFALVRVGTPTVFHAATAEIAASFARLAEAGGLLARTEEMFVFVERPVA